MIDTHCHLTFPELSAKIEQVLERAARAEVRPVITVGTSLADSLRARDVAAAHDGVYFTAGIHPHEAGRFGPEQAERLVELADDRRCVGFGEMGLDYHYPDPPRRAQQRCFAAQLQAVARSGRALPVVVHCRKAVDDTLAVIAESGLPGGRFVFHCFTEGPDDCRKVLEAGCAIGFTGIVTYKNAPMVRDSCRLVPSDRLLLETDSPYLSPEPHRKVRPNEPAYIEAIYRYVAALRGDEMERLVEQVDANARRLFALGVGED